MTGADLLTHLHRGGGAAYLWAAWPDKRKESLWFPVGKQLPTIPAAWSGANIYYGVNPTATIRGKNERSKIATVSAINTLFAEFDAKDFGGDKAAILSHIESLWDHGNGLPYPSVIVDSGGGYHAYWLLEQTVNIGDSNREHLKALQAAWVDLVGADPASKDLARVLRLPGTVNRKYDPPRPVTIIEADERRLYSLDVFEQFTNLDAVAHAAQQATAATTGKQTDDVIASFNQSHPLVDLLLDEGYAKAWERGNVVRLSRPGGASASVVVFTNINRSYHHSGSDPLHTSGHTRDAFDCWTRLVHNGDTKAAWTAAKKAQGKWEDKPAPQQAEQPVNDEGRKPERPTDPKQANPKKHPKIADFVNAAAAMGYTFRRNMLDDTLEVNGVAMDDYIGSELRARMRERGFPQSNVMEDAVRAHAKGRAYHPVREYLESLSWDGKDSIAALTRHFQDAHQAIVYEDGTSRSVFHAWLRRWLIGAIAKAFVTGNAIHGQNPMLVLDGQQDLGKSTFVAWLCSPLPKLFIEAPINPDDKEQHRYLASRWIWEVGELGATTRRQDAEALKDFLTKQEVTFRKPYDRHPVTKPALSSFIGTINDQDGFLVDPTGNRRFLSVKLTAIDTTYSNVDINQVWAQAFALYRSGEPWRLLPIETAMRDAVNDGFTIEDAYQGWIVKYFDIDQAALHWEMQSAEITEVLQDKGVTGGTKTIQMGVSSSLKKLGLERVKTRNGAFWRGITRKLGV